MSKAPFEAAPEGKLLNSGERRKLIFMGVLVLLVVMTFGYVKLQDSKRSEGELNQIADTEGAAFTEQLVVPTLDKSLLAGKILDAREGDRVLLQRETLDLLIEHTDSFHAGHFSALGVLELDATAQASLAAAPEDHRAEAFLARGWLDDLDQRVGPEGKPEHHGRLRLEDESFCHFVVGDLPEGLIIDDFVRLDGLFLKLFRSEGDDGWVEGPLLVGPKLVSSWPRPKEIEKAALFTKLAQITDDTIDGGLTGLGGETFDAQWLLMDSIIRGEDAELDWEGAATLEDGTLVELMTSGHEWRGAPFRIPIARNMDLWTSAAGENPARVDKVTMGWIGSWTWTNNKSAVLHYIMPYDAEHLRGAKLISARGYFIKNFAYETRDGNLRVAPFFVLSHIEEFVPPVDNTIRYIGIGVSSLAGAIIILIFFGLRRDKKRAAAFQADLVRRRRARRERAQASEKS